MTARAISTGLAVVALTAAGCGGGGRSGADGRSASPRATNPPAPTIVTTAADAPGLPAPPRRLRSRPGVGTVRVADGPFNDKLRITALRLRRGGRPAITGRMLTVSDVSEVLALTVDAAFYDRDGRLVATGRHSGRGLEEFFDKPLRFRVQASKPAPTAVTAVVTVPEYVPE